MRLTLVALSFVSLSSLWAQEQPQFAADVNLVTVTFSVKDSRQAFVTHLDRQDIDVLEEGVPQPVQFFSARGDLPLTIGLVLDYSGSQEKFVKRHRADAVQFLKNVLQPKDRFFAVCFGNHVRLALDATNSADSLEDALDHYSHKMSSVPELGGAVKRGSGGTALFDAVYLAIHEKLAHAEGRKALVILSDGEENSSNKDLEQVIRLAQQNDVLLYCIRYTDIRDEHLVAENYGGIWIMQRLATETGGRDFDAQHADMPQIFKEIEEELRSLYELAYRSTHPHEPGVFRRIELHPKDAGLRARCRTGYFVGR